MRTWHGKVREPNRNCPSFSYTTTLEESGGRTTDRLEKLQRFLRIAHWLTMRPSRPLSMYSARLTLFTRSNCSLCDVAKSKIAEVQKKRTLEYNEVDVMAPGQKQWKQLYQYETPVLHIERVFHTNPKPNIVTEAKKLWHRFSAEDIEKLVDEAEQGVA
jgi:glutaredoxin